MCVEAVWGRGTPRLPCSGACRVHVLLTLSTCGRYYPFTWLLSVSKGEKATCCGVGQSCDMLHVIAIG